MMGIFRYISQLKTRELGEKVQMVLLNAQQVVCIAVVVKAEPIICSVHC